jgi:hypothetical protein
MLISSAWAVPMPAAIYPAFSRGDNNGDGWQRAVIRSTMRVVAGPRAPTCRRSRQINHQRVAERVPLHRSQPGRSATAHVPERRKKIRHVVHDPG